MKNESQWFKNGLPRIYIAGKISNATDEEKSRFKAAADFISLHGGTPFDPLKEFSGIHGEWSNYMRLSIPEVCQSAAVYMLPTWVGSEGAELEKEIALRIGIPVLRSTDDLMRFLLSSRGI